MNRSPELYARALLSALDDEPKDTRAVMRRFLAVVKKHRDSRLLPKILAQLERLMVKAEDGHLVTVESARPLEESAFRTIRGAFGAKDRVHAKISPDLIAGLRIVVDGEWVVDASMRKKLSKLFS